MRTAEQLGPGSGKRGGNLRRGRRWMKRATAKLRRRLGKKLLDDAPRRRWYLGFYS